MGSHCELVPLDAERNGGREVFVGWNPGLQTYVAEVIDGVDLGEGHLTVVVGTTVGEVTNADAALDAVRPYVAVPDTVRSLLPRTSTPAVPEIASAEQIDAALGERLDAARDTIDAAADHHLDVGDVRFDEDEPLVEVTNFPSDWGC